MRGDWMKSESFVSMKAGRSQPCSALLKGSRPSPKSLVWIGLALSSHLPILSIFKIFFYIFQVNKEEKNTLLCTFDQNFSCFYPFMKKKDWSIWVLVYDSREQKTMTWNLPAWVKHVVDSWTDHLQITKMNCESLWRPCKTSHLLSKL